MLLVVNPNGGERDLYVRIIPLLETMPAQVQVVDSIMISIVPFPMPPGMCTIFFPYMFEVIDT